MTKKSFTITLIWMFLILATAGFAFADKYQWKLEDTKNNCQIYTSKVPGKDYIAAKTTCIIPARKEVLAVVLRDIPNYPEWMEDCKEARILKTLDDQNDIFIFWIHQHVPLFKDRDMVLKSKVTIDPAKGQDVIYSESTNEMNYDSGKDYVRMPSFYSFFTLDWVDREHTRVTFMIDPDPGEGLLKSVANLMIKKIPYKSLKRLMRVAKNPKYIEAAKTSKYNRIVEDAIKAGYLK